MLSKLAFVAPPSRDADQLGLVVDQRAAAVAGIGRRIGLDHLGIEMQDLVAGLGRPFLLIDLPHLARRVDPQRAAAAGIADRMHRLPRRHARRRNRQRLGPVGHTFDLDQRHVGLLVPGDHPAADALGADVFLVILPLGDHLPSRNAGNMTVTAFTSPTT